MLTRIWSKRREALRLAAAGADQKFGKTVSLFGFFVKLILGCLKKLSGNDGKGRLNSNPFLRSPVKRTILNIFFKY
jgi:hypothetical protein